MRLVAIADLHMQTPQLPEGDILTISGDLTWSGSLEQVEKVAVWLYKQPFKHKIVIAGNHDFAFEKKKTAVKAQNILFDAGITYLEDSGCEIEGRKFYGSPWQPWFHSWAFNVNRGMLSHYWDKIPNDLDVLLVHGPPYGYGDITHSGERVGCQEMLVALQRTKPKKVFYGHIHENVGEWTINDGQTKLYNCSIGPDWINTPRITKVLDI